MAHHPYDTFLKHYKQSDHANYAFMDSWNKPKVKTRNQFNLNLVFFLRK